VIAITKTRFAKIDAHPARKYVERRNGTGIKRRPRKSTSVLVALGVQHVDHDAPIAHRAPTENASRDRDPRG
jgi:hypothetical protein